MVRLDYSEIEKVPQETCLPPILGAWEPRLSPKTVWIPSHPVWSWVLWEICRSPSRAWLPSVSTFWSTAGSRRLGPTKVGLFAPPFIFLSIFKHYSPLSCYHAWFCTLLHLNVHRCTLLRIDALIPPKMYKSAQWC